MNKELEDFFGYTPLIEPNVAGHITHSSVVQSILMLVGDFTFRTNTMDDSTYGAILKSSAHDKLADKKVGDQFLAIIPKLGNPKNMRVNWLEYLVNIFSQVCYQANLSPNPSISKDIKIKEVNKYLSFINNELESSLYEIYVTALASPLMGTKPHQLFVSAAGAKGAKDFYLSSFTSDHFIMAKKGEWEASPGTHHPAWECYHHIMKMIFLDASITEIDQVLEKSISLGLPVPLECKPSKWQSYNPWKTFKEIGADLFSKETIKIFSMDWPVYYDGVRHSINISGWAAIYFMENQGFEFWTGPKNSKAA